MLSAIDVDFYLSLKLEIIATNIDFRPKIKLKSTLNSFKLTIICLEKLKLPLKPFGSGYSDQNNVNIEKIEDNEIIKNSKLIFHVNHFTGMQRLCIFFNLVIEIISITHKDKHLDFIKYYETIVKL